jgi:hypothetical protein
MSRNNQAGQTGEGKEGSKVHLYYEMPEGFTREDMEAEIKAMAREAMKAEALYKGLYEGVDALKLALIRDVLEKEEIEDGDECVMHFSDGETRVLFVGEAARGGFYVRHYGSKGKLRKHPTYYDYTYVDLIERVKKSKNSTKGKENA